MPGYLNNPSIFKVSNFNAARNLNWGPIVEITKLLADERILLLFGTIFLAGGDSGLSLRNQLNLTKKQYYSRMSSLTKSGLVSRKGSRYFVTALGLVIFDVLRLLRSAVQDRWKLKAIDSVAGDMDLLDMPIEERNKILTALIGSEELRDIILSAHKGFHT